MNSRSEIPFKIILFLAFFFSFAFIVSAQNGIDVYADSDANGNYKFYCNNENQCDYTVIVYFDELTNFNWKTTLPYEGVVNPGRNFLFSLQLANPNKQTSMLYNTMVYKGCANPEIDPGFLYLLPISTGQTTEPIKMDFLKIREDDRIPEDYYALGFMLNAGDTVFAARRGVVSEMRDTTSLAHSDYVFSSDDNYIEIFHKDCTFGRYEVFDKSLVSLGQQVEAGDPIAIAGGEKYATGAHVRFYVFYVNQEVGKIRNERMNAWAYVPLFFYTEEKPKVLLNYGQTYTSVKPESVITQEFSKRELKKWHKMKGE